MSKKFKSKTDKKDKNDKNDKNENTKQKESYNTYSSYPTQSNSAPNPTGGFGLAVMSQAITKHHQMGKNKANIEINNDKKNDKDNSHNEPTATSTLTETPNYNSRDSKSMKSGRNWTMAHERMMNDVFNEVATDAKEIFSNNNNNNNKENNNTAVSPNSDNKMAVPSNKRLLSVGSTASGDSTANNSFSHLTQSSGDEHDHDNDNDNDESQSHSQSQSQSHSQNAKPNVTLQTKSPSPQNFRYSKRNTNKQKANNTNTNNTTTTTTTNNNINNNLTKNMPEMAQLRTISADSGKNILSHQLSGSGRFSGHHHLTYQSSTATNTTMGNTSVQSINNAYLLDYHQWDSIDELNHNIQAYINVQLDRVRKHKVLRRPGGESRTFVDPIGSKNLGLIKQGSVNMTASQLDKLTTDIKKKEIKTKDLMKKYPTLERKLVFRIEALPLE